MPQTIARRAVRTRPQTIRPQVHTRIAQHASRKLRCRIRVGWIRVWIRRIPTTGSIQHIKRRALHHLPSTQREVTCPISHQLPRLVSKVRRRKVGRVVHPARVQRTSVRLVARLDQTPRVATVPSPTRRPENHLVRPHHVLGVVESHIAIAAHPLARHQAPAILRPAHVHRCAGIRIVSWPAHNRPRPRRKRRTRTLPGDALPRHPPLRPCEARKHQRKSGHDHQAKNLAVRRFHEEFLKASSQPAGPLSWRPIISPLRSAARIYLRRPFLAGPGSPLANRSEPP